MIVTVLAPTGRPSRFSDITLTYGRVLPRHLFEKGKPRPVNAGRRAGTPNKVTTEVGHFFREALETQEFRMKWFDYFKSTPLQRMDPRLVVLAFAYAYGRPKERAEVSGNECGPVVFTLDLGGAMTSRGEKH